MATSLVVRERFHRFKGQWREERVISPIVGHYGSGLGANVHAFRGCTKEGDCPVVTIRIIQGTRITLTRRKGVLSIFSFRVIEYRGFNFLRRLFQVEGRVFLPSLFRSKFAVSRWSGVVVTARRFRVRNCVKIPRVCSACLFRLRVIGTNCAYRQVSHSLKVVRGSFFQEIPNVPMDRRRGVFSDFLVFLYASVILFPFSKWAYEGSCHPKDASPSVRFHRSPSEGAQDNLFRLFRVEQTSNRLCGHRTDRHRRPCRDSMFRYLSFFIGGLGSFLVLRRSFVLG